MSKNGFRILAVVLASLVAATGAYAAKVVEEIEVEGLVTPASPKALSAALEEKLPVKVLGFNIYATANGWPTVKLEYDSSAVSRDQIEKVINATKDPTGTPFKVHKAEKQIHLALLDEETKADQRFAADPPELPKLSNPIEPSPESLARGEKLYDKYCSKCHGVTGNGAGPSAHGFSTNPRQLWVWHNADKAADPYLFWMITNGRTDMPPWGVILSENERWDLVNYIKTFEPPKQQ
ncbi:MAG: cytochrome c [Gammaproteobacteria bacterium]|nr:cytochrome c [Gammaproteobacteria bacterium]